MLSTARNVPAFASSAARDNIWLLTGPTLLTKLALSGIARVAMSGQTVWVLDGANSFDAFFIARLARRAQHNPQIILSRIRLSRAFTCYQAAHVVQWRLPTDAGASPPAVVFCLGLLETFYDEDVQMDERVRLLQAVLENISRFARQSHLIVLTAREPGTGNGARTLLFNLVQARAGRVERIEPAPPVVDRQFVQARLLDE